MVMVLKYEKEMQRSYLCN
jgi:hypothetical protein